MFDIQCARLAYDLTRLSELKRVCKRVARIVCPEKDINAMSFPSAEQIRLNMIKLDMMHSLRRRQIWSMDNTRISIGLSPDKSPQAGYEYLCSITDTFFVELPLNTGDGFNPLAVRWERRSQQCTVVGQGEATAALTVANLGHVALSSS